MRLARVVLHSPSGIQVTLEANGEGELLIETIAEGGFILIRDTGLPPYPEENETHPRTERIAAQIPLTWAVFPEWEIAEPLPAKDPST